LAAVATGSLQLTTALGLTAELITARQQCGCVVVADIDHVVRQCIRGHKRSGRTDVF